jgi:hypothetical protein
LSAAKLLQQNYCRSVYIVEEHEEGGDNTLKKVIILLAALALVALLPATGCHTDPPASPETVPKGSNEPETKVLMEYEVWENEETFSEEIPEKMQEIIQEVKGDKGYFIFNPQEFSTGKDLFILISSGEKCTGGYSLELKNIVVKNDTLEITVEEKKPLQEKAVIQVLTYPVLLLKIKNDYDLFGITNTAGEAFLPITP